MGLKILNRKSFPQYVFVHQFQKFMFVKPSEGLCSQMDELMFLPTKALKKVGSKKLFSYEVLHKELVPIKTLSIEDDKPDF